MNLQHRPEDYDDSFISENFVKSIVTGALLGGVGFLLWRLFKKLGHPIFPAHPPIIIKSVDDSSDQIGIDTDEPLQELKTASNLYQIPGFGPITRVKISLKNLGPWQETPFNTPNGCEIRMWLQYKSGGQWIDEVGGPHLTVYGTSSDFQLKCDPLSPETVTSAPHRPRKRKLIKNGKWHIGYVEVVGHGRVNRGSNTKMEISIDNT